MNNPAQQIDQPFDVMALGEKYQKHSATASISPKTPQVSAVEVAANESAESASGYINFPIDVAAMPTELTKCNLFRLTSDRKTYEKKVITGESVEVVKITARSNLDEALQCFGSTKIRYQGPPLNRHDESCWLASLRLGRGIKMGDPIRCNISDLLKELDLTDSGGKRGNRGTLYARLTRLSEAFLHVELKRKNKTLKLNTGLMKTAYVEETGEMYIWLDPNSARMFASDFLAYQTWHVRLALKTDLAVKLLTYLTGHARGKPHAQPIRELQRYLGHHGRQDKFAKTCGQALKELEGQGVIEKGSGKVSGGGKNGPVASWVRSKK